MLNLLGKSKSPVAVALFAFCVAPAFISYQPYLFRWDDSSYLQRSIAVSRAFWSGNLHGVKEAMVYGRPPALTLLGLPWGALASWDAAGKCFVSLAAVISLLATLCLYLSLRVGIKPLFLVVASICVAASIGPYPAGAPAHAVATAFMADSLLAWTSLAAVLLIPYEARMPCPSIRGAVVRGILWGAILSLGVMTKLTFFYFIVLIVPTLFLIRLHHGGLRLDWRRSPGKAISLFIVRPEPGGLRSAFASLIAFLCSAAPSAIFLVRYGRPAFALAKASSFGRIADFYYHPLSQFLADTIRASPGLVLSFVFTAAGLIYLVIKKRSILWGPEFLALLIIMGYAIVPLMSANREIRFELPAIVALPFLIGILMSGEGHSAPGLYAALAAGLVFCGLLAAGVPTRHRANRQSLRRCDVVLAQAAECSAKRVMLATDSPTLNVDLMNLAIEVSASEASVEVATMAHRAMGGVPIEADFRWMSSFNQVVFQDGDALSPPFTNQRVPEYERYLQQHGFVPIRIGDDVSVYSMRCRP
jgi:hypothetical protein